MNLPPIVQRALWRAAGALANRRPADIVIGGATRPYMRRWWVIPRNRALNIYLHKFLRDDDDRALHDHPWVNCSILLQGSYREILPTRGGTLTTVIRHAGDVVFRGPRSAHRIELIDGEPCWTLFLTGPRLRSWGFWCQGAGWVHWRLFTSGPNGETVGKGCDQ